MINQEILKTLPEMAQCLHRAVNKQHVQDSNWVHNFIRDFPTTDLRQWDTTVPVLSACAFLKLWFKDHMPNHYLYKGGFTDANLLTAQSCDYIKEQIKLKKHELHKASGTVDITHPFQLLIGDTIMALMWAENLIQCMEDGLFVNWVTFETRSEIEF